MTKKYDPQYSTQVKFNTPIMNEMLNKRDISLVKHWFDNGEPHKKLASEALNTLLFMQWIEALELLWDLGWLTKKNILTSSWINVTCNYSYWHSQPLKNTATEKWLIDKTYNHKILSKNELNSLHLSILDNVTKSRNNYYWDMFFTDDVVFKGKKSHDIFFSLNYFSNPSHYNSNSAKDEEFEKLSKERFNQFISHPNGFEADPHHILTILIKQEQPETFWKIINSKFNMNKKDLFLFAIYSSLYFKGVGYIIKKMKDEEIDIALDTLMKSFVRAGLTETITFTKKDITGDYENAFKFGHISLSNINMMPYLLSRETTASHMPYVENRYHKEDEITDITFNTGESFFAKLVKDKKSGFSYSLVTEKDKVACNKKMLSYLNN